jgi:type IV pilus assembly protein PilM
MTRMGLVDAFRPPVVGLDLGSHTVKAVALRPNRNGWTLLAAGETPMPAGERVTQEQVSETAAALLDTLGLRRAHIAAALSGQAVIVKRLALPPMKAEELAEAIPWEAEQYIPFAIADVQLDYQVLAGGSGKDTKTDALDVLLVAARRDRVEQRAAAVAATGRRPAVLDVEAFALANAYTMNYPTRIDPLSVLIHIGRSTTIVCALEQGQPVFTRDISIGGAAYSEAMERELGYDAAASRRVLHGQKSGDESGVNGVLREVHLQLIMEVRKTLDFYWSTTNVLPLSRIMLSGGACQVDGLSVLLDQEFNTAVEIIDPFKLVSKPGRAVGAELEGPSFSVAVGLAMRREGDR